MDVLSNKLSRLLTKYPCALRKRTGTLIMVAQIP